MLNLLGQSMKLVYDTGVRPAAVPVRQRSRVRDAHRAIAILRVKALARPTA